MDGWGAEGLGGGANFPLGTLVSRPVFNRRHRPGPLDGIFDWVDYNVSGVPPPLPGRHAGFGQGFGHPWGSRRRSPLARLLIGLAIVVAVVYIIQRLTSSRRNSWL